MFLLNGLRKSEDYSPKIDKIYLYIKEHPEYDEHFKLNMFNFLDRVFKKGESEAFDSILEMLFEMIHMNYRIEYLEKKLLKEEKE